MVHLSFRQDYVLSVILSLCAFTLGGVLSASVLFTPINNTALSLIRSAHPPSPDMVMRGFSLLGGEDFLILMGASLFRCGIRREGIAYIGAPIISQMVNFQPKTLFPQTISFDMARYVILCLFVGLSPFIFLKTGLARKSLSRGDSSHAPR